MSTQALREPKRTYEPKDLTKFAWLSIATALVTMALKAGAWWITGSVGLLSDALESSVNLVAAIVALISLRAAARPADANHQYGHTKAEYFSAVVEGGMIFVAAAAILVTSAERFINPRPLENLGIGLVALVVAAVMNGAVGGLLIRVGREHRSLTLVADGKHLMTDLITSIGVLVGVVLVWLTGWERLDPVVAFLVGLNIIWTGFTLLRDSVAGLMDAAWPTEDSDKLALVIAPYLEDPVSAHGLRTREAGRRRFVEMHVLVPGSWTVRRGHDVVEEIENAITGAFEHEVQISIHLEPSDDPRSYDDFEHEVEIPTPEEAEAIEQALAEEEVDERGKG